MTSIFDSKEVIFLFHKNGDCKKNNRRYYYTRSQNQVCVWRSGISEHTGPVLPKTMAWKSRRWLNNNSLDDLISVWKHRGFNNNLLLMCHIKGKASGKKLSLHHCRSSVYLHWYRKNITCSTQFITVFSLAMLLSSGISSQVYYNNNNI